jgi:GT2 family glycosyltransferase
MRSRRRLNHSTQPKKVKTFFIIKQISKLNTEKMTIKNSLDQRPLVSIITVNYRQAAVTCDLLDTLVKNSYADALEIIVVDNGSTFDPTAQFRQHAPSVKVIVSAANLGFAGGNNLGIAAATADYLFFVNNDTLFTEGLVETLLARLASDPKIGAVSPKICYAVAPNNIQYAGFTAINPLTGRNRAIGKNAADNGDYDRAYPTAYAHGAAMMVRRQVVEQVGMMPTVYFLYYEELDWCAQMQRANYSTWYEGNTRIFHRESVSVGKASPLKIHYQIRNRLLFMRRNAPKMGVLFFIPYFLSVTIFSNLVNLLKPKRRYLVHACLKSFGEGLTVAINATPASNKLYHNNNQNLPPNPVAKSVA